MKLAFALAPVFVCLTLSAQQQSAPSEQELQKQEQSQRILGVVPMFGTTSRSDAAPLTAAQKFTLFRKSAFDPVEFPIFALQAGISQSQNEFPGYGQGAQGYGKRFGATMADSVSSNFFSNYAYPALLREDPRYFRSGTGPVRRRIAHALAQEFTARRDSTGRFSFNYANLLGAFSSGGLSNLYYPSSDRGFGLTMSRSVIQLGYGSLGGLVSEFWPDVQMRISRRKRTAVQTGDR
ncbi:MAG: hypothetical protein JOZ43_05650 [Acidobacteriales bacterium]|nr:hypothetical protein [Terriglobales bacterium]